MSRAVSSRPNPPPPGTGPAIGPGWGLWLSRLFGRVDRLADRGFTNRFNPLHQTGNIAIVCFLVALVTGLYLFLFYRIATPHESIARLEQEIWLGGWVRALHRYAADLAMVAIVLHLLRKLAQGHTWGPRFFAWVTGIALTGLVLLCGWTGLILVWDTQAQVLAMQGARLLDLLPILSEPVSRTFTGENPVPSSFFFMNLFLHLALPLGLAALIGIHVAKVARPRWLPPRPLAWGLVVVLMLVAVVVPLGLGPAADLRRVVGRFDVDLFYTAWLPFAQGSSALLVLTSGCAGALALLLLPRLWRPSHEINTSWVDENSCTGCTTCSLDCPYGAIAMVPRSIFDRQTSELVARVDDSRCVGCGICAGSCAPMGVGPYGRTGRDQLALIRALFDDHRLEHTRVVVFACRQALGGRIWTPSAPGVFTTEVSCAGSVHTSAVEVLLRRGVAGVVIASCGPRACSFREGPTWLDQRLFHGREAELHDRVDRRRIEVVATTAGDTGAIDAAIARLLERVEHLDTNLDPDLAELLCRPGHLLVPARTGGGDRG